MNSGPWYSQLHNSGLHWAGFLFIALLLICCLVPVVAAEQVSENSKAAVAPPHIYPYTGFRCLDKAPCFGGRLSFSYDGFARRPDEKNPRRITGLTINWGDGTENTVNSPPTTGTITHIYKTPQKFTITFTGHDEAYDYGWTRDTYVQHYNLDLSLMPGDILVHSIDENSPYASTLSTYVPGHWTHSAMYILNNQTIESGGSGIKIHSVADWVYPADECVAIFRVPGLTDTQRMDVIWWALGKKGKPYDFTSLLGWDSGKQVDTETYDCQKRIWPFGICDSTCRDHLRICFAATKKYYCSELIWASYLKTNGIDLDPEPPVGCVYPFDLVMSKHVTVELVGTHIEKIPKRAKAYSTTDTYYRLLLNASPGDVVKEPRSITTSKSYMFLVNADSSPVVKDAVKSGSCDTCGPVGNSSEADNQAGLIENQVYTPAIDPFETRIINPDKQYMTDSYSTIPGSTYGAIDTNGDNLVEMMNSIENAEVGEYTISVTPKAGTGQDYTYSLRIGAWDIDQISWIEPINYMEFSALPDAGKMPLRIEENGYCRIIAVPTRGTAPFNVSFMDISPLMRTDEDWDYEDMVINNQWDFGDGTSATDQVTVTHLYTTPGSYQVMLTTRNATLEATASVTVTIEAPIKPLKADFTASPVTGTAPLTVKCTDNSTGSPTTVVYDFGDGRSAISPNSTHIYLFPGVYTITQTVMKYDAKTNSVISNSTTKKNCITANSIPVVPLVANFNAGPLQGTAPMKVTFADQSTGNPTFYMYDFGDGTNTLEPNPVHTYRYPGTYTVTLSVRKSDGNTGTIMSNSSIQKDLIVVNST